MASFASQPLLHHMKILIVDDERPSVVALERLLRASGYTRVQSVTRSCEAVDLCTTFQPDIVLLDLIMPDPDGFTVLEQLRATEEPEDFLPIIILTADTTEEAKERALESGATDFLVKPASRAEALLRIRNLLEVRRLHLVLENQRAALEEAVRERAVELRRALTPELR